LTFNDSLSKGPFIATQLNSTQLVGVRDEKAKRQSWIFRRLRKSTRIPL